MSKRLPTLTMLLLLAVVLLPPGSVRSGLTILGCLLALIVFITGRRDASWWWTLACVAITFTGALVIEFVPRLSPATRQAVALVAFAPLILVLVVVVQLVKGIVNMAPEVSATMKENREVGEQLRRRELSEK